MNLFSKAEGWLHLMGLAFLFACCFGCAQKNVVRVVDGKEIEGRFVHPHAYSLFLQGVLAEQDGRLSEAEKLYLKAHQWDRREPAIVVRLAAIRCALGPSGHDAAQQAFDKAIRMDSTYPNTYLEQARCELQKNDPKRAEEYARKALSLSPWDVEVSLVLAEALEKLGQQERAVRVLHALELLSSPRQTEQGHDSMLSGDLEGIDEALGAGDLELATRKAVAARADLSVVATRAAALGRWKEAMQLAKVLLAAEPGHPDAIAVWLSSPEPREGLEAREAASWRRSLDFSGSTRSLSDLGALIVTDALQRRFGPEIAKDFLETRGISNPIESDPLARSLFERVRIVLQ